MSSSQLAFLEEIIKQDVVSANDTNNENSLSVDAALPGKTVSTVPAQNTGAVITMNEKFIALNHKVCSKYNICEKISVRMFSSYKCLQVNINIHYQI